MKIIDSKIWDIGTKLYDLIVINLLWMIFSIPLITLGPATYAGLKCIEELEDGSSHNIFILYSDDLLHSLTKITEIMRQPLIIQWYTMALFVHSHMDVIFPEAP